MRLMRGFKERAFWLKVVGVLMWVGGGGGETKGEEMGVIALASENWLEKRSLLFFPPKTQIFFLG